MKILVAGDFCPQNRVAEAFEHDRFESVLSEVCNLTTEADYSIVNLECPITKGGEKPISKVGSNLQCSEKGVAAIKYAGFDCVTLANNHFYDYGDEGVSHTLEACDKYGIDSVGGGRNLNEAVKTFYKQINGQTLAVINCCEHEFSIATDKTGGSNPLDPIQHYYAIHEARMKADFVLVIVHGGHEHWQLPSPRMVETYHFFIDAGADVVVNHHQHCFSGYEIYKSKPIFYGLGNFCFDDGCHIDDNWNFGYVVLLNFMPQNVNYSIHLYKQCGHHPSIIFLDSVENRKIHNRICDLNVVIASHGELSKEYEKYVDSARVAHIFEPYSNRFLKKMYYSHILPSFVSKKKKLELLAYLQCESHIVKVLNYLKNK